MTLGEVASVLLGLAFVVAGASKLAAGPSWPAQAAGMGAPRWSVQVLPWIELAIGALLITFVGRRVAALAALGLLGAFTGLIVVRLREGKHPPCACFGAWSAKPLGWGHVARNAGLIVLGMVALVA